MRDDTSSLLSQPTSLLENVSFWFDSTPGGYIPFPSNILPNAPRLRSIHFGDIRISWDSAIFKHGSLIDLRLMDEDDKGEDENKYSDDRRP